MKKLLIGLSVTILFFSCDKSEGTKSGILQKVSNKNFPCSYYEIQVAYEGGAVVQTGDKTNFSNTQDFTVNKSDFDSLSAHVGDKIVFSYKDRGFTACEPSKILTSFKFK